MFEQNRPEGAEELQRHAKFLRALARGILGDDSTAEDAVQDAFVAAMAQPTTPGKAWLARVTQNAARSIARSEARRVVREHRVARPECWQIDDEVLAHTEVQRRVMQAVAELNEPYRSVIHLRYYRGLSTARIATMLGLPRKTVESRLTRAHRRLHSRLAPSESDRYRWATILLASGRKGTGPVAFAGALIIKKVFAAALVLVLGTSLWFVANQGSPTPRRVAPPELEPVVAAPARESNEARPATREREVVGIRREAADDRLLLRVTGAGQALKAARVFTRSPGDMEQPRQVGATDADGLFATPFDGRGVVEGFVEHDGFTTTRFRAEEAGREVEVELLPLGRIEGRVLLPWGAPPPEPVPVMATAAGTLWCTDKGAAEVLCGETDQSGRFSIENADRNRRYMVTMITRDFVVHEPARNVVPNQSEVSLTASLLYAVRLRVVGGDNQPLLGSPFLVMQHGGGAACLDSSAKLFARTTELAAAGVPGFECDPPTGDWVLAFAVDQEKPSVGPIQVQIARPGYERVTAAARAYPVAEGVIEKEIRLTPTPLSRGTVEIAFLDLPSDGEVDCKVHCTLRPKEGDAMTLIIPRVSPDPFRIGGVPTGEYEWSAVSRSKLFRFPGVYPGPLVEVIEGETARVEISFEGHTTLRCDALDAFGRTYTGPLVLSFRKRGRNAIHFVRFESAPYVVPGVPAGTYDIHGREGVSYRGWTDDGEPYGATFTADPAGGEGVLRLVRRD